MTGPDSPDVVSTRQNNRYFEEEVNMAIPFSDPVLMQLR
jgi:hypothetical protein